MNIRLRASLLPLIGLVIAPVVWLAAPTPVSAQGVGAHAAPAKIAAPHAGPRTYGPIDQVSRTFSVGEFAKSDNTVTWQTIVSGATGVSVFQTSTTTRDWWQGVSLPNGAIIDTVELEACDTSATGQIIFGMAAGDSPGGPSANVTSIGTTGLFETPGCAFFTVEPTAPPLVVDNRNHYYLLFLNFVGDFTGAASGHAVRVFYRLQVSPAPAVATFNDVPTSDFGFQFVEAFGAAGITVGCTDNPPFPPPVYCPDRAVTRREIAIFFAKALGLHFPD